MAKIAKAVTLMFVMMFLGLFFSIVVAEMWDRGIILDQIGETYPTITLSDLMFAVFFGFTLLGLLLGFIVGVWD